MLSDFGNEIQFVGRLLFGGAFVVAGIRNIQSADFLTQMMGARGVPLPRASLWAGILIQLVGGVALAFGLLTPWAGLALIVFIIAATLKFHSFAGLTGPERVAAINGVISNTALVGGLLAMIAAAA